MNLKNAIISHYCDIELTNITHDIITININDKIDLHGDLKIIGYPNLQSINIQKNSLINIRSLIIKNNPLLKSI